jgi:phenylalanine-4-hydroxylase
VASVSAHVPPHLRRFVVSQDYEQYTAIDQAVWRFVLLQMRARLVETAHPAYAEGLSATGISIDRIPSIAEMNEKLGQFGWGAVCVDGFIPPRAFQEFQSRGLLPIAADMRTREHIAYTPAPDIIHEGAGHAPILAEPAYAAYLRRIGDIAKRAFSLPEEERVFQASYLLSEVKEDPNRSPASVARVEAELAEALASVPEDSEATWLSRLYWWTAEYGLVGRVDDYRMYGAGLLSSLGESHSCHAPGVRKLPLDAACIEIGYDITRPQPQLFVTRDFEELHAVLEEVSRKLAVTLGGAVALERAARSGELASLRFSSGAWAMGVLREVGPSLDCPAWLRLAGPAQFARDGKIHPAERELRPLEQWLLPGGLADGVTLDGLVTRATATGDPLHLQLSYGARVEGCLGRAVYDEDGRILHLELEDVRLDLPGRPPVLLERYAFVLLGNFVTAQAGAVDPTFHAETKFSSMRVPKARPRAEREAALVTLYERVAGLPARGAPGDTLSTLEAVHARLATDEPREWLLRWNLLEKALGTPGAEALARTLGAELEALELAYERREPIAMGLGFLRGR